MVPEPLTSGAISGWTSLAILLGKIILMGVMALGLSLAWPGLDPDPVRVDPAEALLLVGLLAVVAHHWKRTERRPFSDLGFLPRGRGLTSGLMAGLIGVVLTTGAGMLAGWSILRPGASWPEPGGLALLVTLAFVTAILEEGFFRGVVQRILLRATRWPVAVAATATLFAATHFLAPGSRNPSDLMTTFAGLWATGFTLGWAALKRGLWFPVGVHACWIVAITGSALHNPLVFLAEGAIWTGNGFPPRGLLGMLTMAGLLLLLGRPEPSGTGVANSRESIG